MKIIFKACDICQRCKSTNQIRFGEMKCIIDQGINYQSISMDLYLKEAEEISVCGDECICKVCPDIPIAKTKTLSLLKCLNDYLNKFWAVNKAQSVVFFIPIFWPVRWRNSNMVVVEIVHTEIGRCLRTYHRNWTRCIPVIA